MGYQTAPHSSLGVPCGLYQFMSLTEGTALLYESVGALTHLWLPTHPQSVILQELKKLSQKPAAF